MKEALPLWFAGIWLGVTVGWCLGVEYPPCCPGLQRSCETEDATHDSGVQYCREWGWGWERCQRLKSDPYPQALWRKR